MNLFLLLSVVLVQVLPFAFAHADYVKFVKQVRGGDNFNTEVIKNEVLLELLIDLMFFVETCHGQVLRTLLWLLQENDTCL